MQIFEDVNREDVFIVVFDFDDWSKIKLEAQRTGRLIKRIVLDVLTHGVEKYKYTKRENAVC